MTRPAEERIRGMWAFDPVNVRPIDHESYFQEAINDTIVQLRDLHAQTNFVLWTLDGADIRVTFDAAHNPAAGAAGHLFVDGSTGVWSREMAQAVRMTREAAVNATIRVTQLARVP